MPAMNAAISALNTLKQNDITIVKSMASPPTGVKLVMEAVCILKGIKPERKMDQGKPVDDYWSAAKKVKTVSNLILGCLHCYWARNQHQNFIVHVK